MPSSGTADGSTTIVVAASGGSGGGNESDTGDTGVGGGANPKCAQLSLTPRFTQEEKEILYGLFHQHEEVIDIKFRKKQKSKYSVRDAWEQIVHEFNSHQGVSAIRNLKQIQKFWLNARLRKQYPFRHIAQKHNNNNNENDVEQQQQQQQQQQQLVDHTIKDEPEFQVTTNESPEPQSQGEEYEEMELDASGVNTLDDDPLDQQQQQQQQQHVQHQQHVQQHVQQQQPTATIQTQAISVDQISAEKLTLNDLLQFKTARPREEIILQIKHPSDTTAAQITIPSPTRITIPTHHQQVPQQHTMATITASGYNQQIISEIKPQQITLAQYQAQQQQQQQQQLAVQQQQQQQLAVQQQQLVVQQQLHHQQQQQQQQQQHHPQVKLQLQSPSTTQHFVSAGTPTFTCTTFNTLTNPITPTAVLPATLTAVTNAGNAVAAGATTTVAVESFEEKINYFKLKEAELRFKEEQVALEKKKIELSRAQEELKHLRELHRLQVEEVKMKIRILQEEEKLLRKNNIA